MYTWIIEADVHRYGRALATTADPAERRKIGVLLRKAQTRLGVAQTPLPSIVIGTHPD